MVIANSDSTSTLVSLNDEGKHDPSDRSIKVDGDTGLQYYDASRVAIHSTCSTENYLPTNLLMDRNSMNGEQEHLPFYLPRASMDVDDHITQCYYGNETSNATVSAGGKILQGSRERLFAKSPRVFGDHQQDRLLYVAQGERANATSEDYDILMSDKATTCHILAFYSRPNSSEEGNKAPLASLTHLDGFQYEQCVRDMIQDHIDYHIDQNKRRRSLIEEEKKSDETREDIFSDYQVLPSKRRRRGDGLTLEIHVLGGFNDDDGSSSGITNWLMKLLARLAGEFQQQDIGVRMVVKTLVVSSSNNEVDDQTKMNRPIGRGLGVDLRTGEVFLAQCKNDDQRSCGPVPVLRSVRLWSRSGSDCSNGPASHLQPEKLSVVHTYRFAQNFRKSTRKEYSLFWVQPFQLKAIADVDILLNLPDHILLQYTSTSPEVEEPGFCKDVRDALQFLKEHCEVQKDDGSNLFGKDFDRPMVFAICHGDPAKSNETRNTRGKWKQLSSLE